MRAVVGAVLALWLGALPAGAATLNFIFDHATDQGATLGTLGIGVNRVAGTNSGVCVPSVAVSYCQGLPTWASKFSLDLPEYGRITAVTVIASNIHFEGSGAVGPQFSLNDPYIYQGFDVPGGQQQFEAVVPPSGPLNFFIAPDNYRSLGTYSHDWEVRVEVAPIPLPGTLSLMGAALAGLSVLAASRVGASHPQSFGYSFIVSAHRSASASRFWCSTRRTTTSPRRFW